MVNALSLHTFLAEVDWKKVAKKICEGLAMVALALLFVFLTANNYGCSSIWTKGQSMAEEIYTNVKNLAGFVAGAMFVVALFVSLFSKDTRKVEPWIDWAKRILIIFLVMQLGGWIFQWISQLSADAPTIPSLF